MTLGERIKNRRLELGYTQEEVANKLGYKSRSSYNKMENANVLSLKKVEKLASVLETSPAYLMGWEEEEAIASAMLQATLDNYVVTVSNDMSKMSEEQKKRLASYAKFLLSEKEQEDS